MGKFVRSTSHPAFQINALIKASVKASCGAPPGLEHELGANSVAQTGDMIMSTGEGSPVKIRMDSLSFQSLGQGQDMLAESAQEVPLTTRQALKASFGTSQGIVKRAEVCEIDTRTRQATLSSTARNCIEVPLLLQARLSAEEDVSLYEVLPCLGGVARHEMGSKFLRARLLLASQETQAMICGAALPEVVELSMHQFGHTFILQLLEVSSSEQKKVLTRKLASHVSQLSLDHYGCFVIQKALQVMSRTSREQLIAGLKDGALECIKSRHGNHVIQMCVEEMPWASVSFVLHAVESWGAEAASAHNFACRVVMRLLEHMPREQLNVLLRQIVQCACKLAKDRYGNYVLQHILENGAVIDKKAIVAAILENDVLELAKHKYAHNVIAKCIQVSFSPESELALEADRRALSKALLEKSDEEILENDRFGSMVIECLMDHLSCP